MIGIGLLTLLLAALVASRVAIDVLESLVMDVDEPQPCEWETCSYCQMASPCVLPAGRRFRCSYCDRDLGSAG